MKRFKALLPLALLLTACSAQPNFIQPRLFAPAPLLQAQAFTARAVTTITVDEAHQWLQDPNAAFVILDVRTPAEFAQGHLAKARDLDFYDSAFQNSLQQLDRNQPYIIYCHSGNRSGQALEKMRTLGFKNVYNVSGGITAWQAKGFPVVQ